MSIYQPSPIKRARASKAELESRKNALFDIVCEIQPCTVRQAFYQAEIAGVVEKTEAGYDKVQRALADMRRAGTLPYGWIADNTRWQRRPITYGNPAEAIGEVARFYRKDLWRDADVYVEIWLEKDALSGVIYPATSQYDVPLMVARGYSSLSFLHGSAEYIAALDVPAYVYHLGDFDPSGVNAAETIETTLRELAPCAEIHFERIAVLPEQILAWDLPTRPTKATDTRAKRFGYTESVELDAIHPDTLRDLVAGVIEKHLPPERYALLQVAEASERKFLEQWASVAKGAA
ncbi:MAG: hypothetical protein H0W93_08055 [Gammaproteobacteria bacterium]|nr:hypothetical protein [Gammaproteobacteria bacterium]